MSNKKKILTLSLASVFLLLSNTSFSEIASNKPSSGLYISGQYKPSVSIFSNFSVRETNTTTAQLVGLKKSVDSIAIDTNSSHGTGSSATGISKAEHFNVPYKAEFQDNAASFSGTIGYSFKGPRIEIEGFYEKFDVKDPGGYLIQDAHRYFAIARKMNDTPIKTSQPKEESNSSHHTVMRNDGLSVSSIVINSCYDFPLGKLPVLPYICIGVGIDAIEFFDALHIKFSNQGKLGITYPLSSKINLFADGYYHKVIGNQFRNLNVQHIAELHDAPKVTSAVATLNVSYFGGEIGARFIF